MEYITFLNSSKENIEINFISFYFFSYLFLYPYSLFLLFMAIFILINTAYAEFKYATLEPLIIFIGIRKFIYLIVFI
jgi:hypothetical protein